MRERLGLRVMDLLGAYLSRSTFERPALHTCRLPNPIPGRRNLLQTVGANPTLALTLTQGGATFSKEWEAARLVLQGGLQRRVQRAKARVDR